MKLLFGLAVAILVLATTLEVVNAGNCPPPFKPIPDVPAECYWSSKDVKRKENYANAKSTCENNVMKAKLMHSSEIYRQLLYNHWIWDPEYWVESVSTPPCLQAEFDNSGVEVETDHNCADKLYFICIKNAECNCTVKDDPLILGGDGATSLLVGEGRYHLLEYENQTNVCEFNVKIRASESDSFQLMVDEIEINLSDDTTIYVDIDQYQILPDGNIPYNASLDGIVFQRDAVLDTEGNVTTAGYQLRQTEEGNIVFEVDDCYQSMEVFPGGDHFDLTVSLEAVGHSAISGLCGNFDDDPSNDFTTADGRDVSDQPDRYGQLSDSYRIQSP